MRRIVAFVAAVAIAASMSGCSSCSPAAMKSREISRNANDFDRMRRITVINTRTDTVIWRLTGRFAMFHDTSDLDVIVAIGDNQYAKYYCDLNEWTTYVVEDLTAEHLPDDFHEIEFLPGQDAVAVEK